MPPEHASSFANGKAIGFFDRHADSRALRRGLDGIREHMRELLEKA